MNEVYPIKDEKKLREIIFGLKDYRNMYEKRIYLLFMTGICTGLRIGDLIRLKVGQVNHGDTIKVIEEMTGKCYTVKINKQLRAVFDKELFGMNDEDFLFPSRQKDRRGREKHITVSTAEKDMEKIAYWFNIKFPFSCHSLRKTYGYWHYQTNRNLPMLARQFNHSDLRVTEKYIGLDEETILDATERMFNNIIPTMREVKERDRKNQENEPVLTKHHDRTKQKAAYVKRWKKVGPAKRNEEGKFV